MQKYLSDSTASFPGGIGPGHRIFKVQTGKHAGRIALLMQSSSTEIKLSWSDYPYVSWSTPSVVINDAADYPFDAMMTPDGTIYLVYTLGSNDDIVFRKLSLSVGIWIAGELVTIYDGDDNYFPSICLEEPNRIWVAWSRLASGQYNVNAKYSDDWGTNWAGGSSSYGETLLASASSAYIKAVTMADYVYAIYSHGNSKISYRRKNYQVSNWEDEVDIFSGYNLDFNFDACVSQDGRLGVAWDDGDMKFREFDGSNWSGVYVVDTNGGESPQVKYVNNIPHVVYISAVGSGQNNLVYCCRDGSGFSNPEILVKSKSALTKVICYNASSAGFEDVTAAASDSTAGDIYHSVSSAIIKEVGDTLYIGLSERFHYLKAILSTAGVGGSIVWQYYNGNEWISFVPSSGNWHFADIDKNILLWDDLYSVPGNWQKNSVNGTELFWVRITAALPFSIGPVGTQMTTIPDIKSVVLMER